MSTWPYLEEDLDIFLNKHEKDKEKIFNEIREYLGKKKFISKKEFFDNYFSLLSKENNCSKTLSSGLILKIGDATNALELTDCQTFTIKIEYLKKIKIKSFKGNSYKFIISERYFNKIIKNTKDNHLKYKETNKSKESTLESNEFDIKVIFNKNFDYLSIIPNYKNICDEVFEILEKEKSKKEISPKDFFNKFRLLNFPEIQKYDLDKINWKLNFMDFSDTNYKYFCYNKKIGLSIYLQRNFNYLSKRNIKFFYLNIDFLMNESSSKNIRNYLIFYMSNLYLNSEKDKYIEFIENDLSNNIEYKGKILVEKILDLLVKNFKDYELYIDNIKTKFEFDIVDNFIKTYDLKTFAFIQINNNTVGVLSGINYKLVENLNNFSILEDFEFYLPLNFGEINESQIRENYTKNLRNYFKNVDYEGYRFLLKIKYFLNAKKFYLFELNTYGSFLEFILVDINKNIVNKINFRNNIIEEIFNDLYEGYITKIINTDKNIFSEISKSNEGQFFEKQIIYDTIINNININKIRVDKIFSIKEFPINIIDKKEDILLIQINANAPYYDFGFIYRENNINILKLCQIGINKSKNELLKLNPNFLLLDIYYFCQKMHKEKQIEINKAEICLITTIKAYEESINNNTLQKERQYKNFEVMKDFCNHNNYLFFIYDVKNLEFFRLNSDNELITTDLKYSEHQKGIMKIFNNDDDLEGIKKLNYNFKLKDPQIIGKIKINKNFNTEQLNPELVFQVKKNSVIFYCKENNINKNDELDIDLNDDLNENEEYEDEDEEEKEDTYDKKEISEEENESNDIKESDESESNISSHDKINKDKINTSEKKEEKNPIKRKNLFAQCDEKDYGMKKNIE